MGRFEGRVVVVTGAGSGIGRASALRFGEEGGDVVCADIDGAAAADTAATITEKGGTAQSACLDVGDPDAVSSFVDRVAAEHGGLHVVANIAGAGCFRHTADVDLAEWERILRVNLTGTFLVCQAAIPHLLETHGNIVNMGSTTSFAAQPYAAAYCASKGGVLMLTKALAVEYGRRNIRVNCVCPGGVATPLLGGFVPPEGADMQLIGRIMYAKRAADPAEVAAVVAFLASDDASYVNGAAYVVDGAMTT
jgi:NAD(P)-dependent dehydrogenase (short-subunit alcohol dehydrogenase family)